MIEPKKMSAETLATWADDIEAGHLVSTSHVAGLLAHIAALDLDIADLRIQRDATGAALVSVTAERDGFKQSCEMVNAAQDERDHLRAALEKCGADLDAATARVQDHESHMAAMQARITGLEGRR